MHLDHGVVKDRLAVTEAVREPEPLSIGLLVGQEQVTRTPDALEDGPFVSAFDDRYARRGSSSPLALDCVVADACRSAQYGLRPSPIRETKSYSFKKCSTRPNASADEKWLPADAKV